MTAALDDGPKKATDVIDAAKREGHAEASIKRAKALAGVTSTKDGYQGANYWALPADQLKEAHTPRIEPDWGG